MCEYIEKSIPESRRCPQVENLPRQMSAFSRCAPSGGNPSWKIRPLRWPAASGGNLSRKLLFFVCKTNILCVSRVLHMKSALGASRWDAHQKVSMTVLSFIRFGWDNARIRAKLVRILIKEAEIWKLTLASICLLACPMTCLPYDYDLKLSIDQGGSLSQSSVQEFHTPAKDCRLTKSALQ